MALRWRPHAAQQVVVAGIGTETLCIIVIIVRHNLTLSLQKKQYCLRRRALRLGSRTQSRMTNSLR